MTPSFSLACPIPIQDYPSVVMAHGGGGRLMNQLIEKLFLAAFANPALERRQDGAVLNPGPGRIAFTTDSYVVNPLFFPGSDIGAMAVNGTVNDLAMCGARPKWLSAGFILEEGLPMETLWRVVQSMSLAARQAGVEIVTGDTKVVDHGRGHGLYLNTAGVGVLAEGPLLAPASVRPGDAILLSGDLGRHGMAVMSVREGLQFESPILSDCAPLHEPVLALLEAGLRVHCLRDLTRGGLTAALNEIAVASGLQLDTVEEAVPVDEPVRGACEILGMDPFSVANEGRFAVWLDAADAPRALEMMRGFPVCAQAALIGSASAGTAGLVTVRSRLGVRRILDLLSGEQLPRIC